jgi:DNA ligase (NAD+)
MGTESQSQALTILGTLQFDVARPYKATKSVAELLQHHAEVFQARENLEYEVDGVVYKVHNMKVVLLLNSSLDCQLDSFTDQGVVGEGVRSPRWAIAHKFAAQSAITRLLDIEVNVGRTGVLTPVAILAPVSIGGVEVCRATLHNEREINRKQLVIGCNVVVERSGDVIPKVVCKHTDVVEDSTAEVSALEFKMPSACPVCGSKTERDQSFVAVKCTGGFLCEAQAVQRLLHFVGRAALDIEGLGEERLRDFYSRNIVRTPADIFTLCTRDTALGIYLHAESGAEHDVAVDASRLRNHTGWGEKSVLRLFDAIDKSRKVPLNKFIFALGIRYVGEVTARILAAEFGTFRR